jgi:hypothetical protein
MALIEKLSAIGNAIREKTGKADKLSLDQMPVEIASIVSGGGGGGITLLESGSFTLAAESTKYYVGLANVPDLFICYAEVPETDTSSAALDGAICLNCPQIANMIPYKTNYVTNANYLINWYTSGVHQFLEGYAYVSENETGATANILARSGSYMLKAKTYKWEAYRLWE